MNLSRRHLLAGLAAIALPASAQDVDALKAEILALARRIAATRTDRLALRAQLDILFRNLLALSPQKPLRSGLPQLVGTWSTVLAPSDKAEHGQKNLHVDVDNVYQVISPNGYYYNIIPLIDRKNPAKSKLGLLRGEYGFSTTDPTLLTIHYTRFYGCEGCVADAKPWRFAALEEMKALPNRVNIVPDLFLPLVLPDSDVLEVWSDFDMRLAYGNKGKTSGKRSLYVMKKV